jgi:CheY-like chemotaxis protein
MQLRPLGPRPTRVLIVADDPVTCAALGKILASHGFATLTSDNGRAAGKILQTQHVDLVVTDIFMPVCDGLELIAMIGHMPRVIPVIAMSDRELWTGLRFLDAANDLGAAAVLQKPFSASALLQLIAQVLLAAAGRGPAGPSDEASVATRPWSIADFERLDAAQTRATWH